MSFHRYGKLACHLGSHSVTCHTGVNSTFTPRRSRYWT